MLGDHGARVEKRRFLRIAYSDAVRYQFKDSGRFGGCIARDISEEGIRLDMEDFVPVNTEMLLQMKLQTIPKVVDLKGRVVWLQQIPYSDRYHVGLQFSETNPLYTEGIRSCLRANRP